MHNLIIGTAGHVDHGKTELVKALTGKDTDRLSEEKERGISIVLGFAPIDLGEGITAGIVDVPGHERFVKNMVSGAVGVDLALMVVAADEGVMPQTREHFEVLKLLGIENCIIAITKTDLVDGETVDVVKSEVADLLEGSPLEGSPFVRTSAVTGEGIEELRGLLAYGAAAVAAKREEGFFRIPVDRVFSKPGIGTIVTGTTWSGRVKKGDELVVEPGGKKVRVREVHSFDRETGEAGAGMRTALALHGVRVGEVSTGSQVVTPGVLERSSMLDLSLEVSMLPGSRIKNRQRVRFHHAAGELLGRVVLLDREELGEGERGFVQLRLEEPAFAVGGDRFVLRRYSPMRVLAGGKILDPAAARKRRFDGEALSLLGRLEEGSDREKVLALADSAGTEGLPEKRPLLYGVRETEREVAALEEEKKVFRLGGRIYSAEELVKFERKIFGLLDSFQSGENLIWGMDRVEPRVKPGAGGGQLFDHVLGTGEREGRLFFRGARVRAGSGEIELSAEESKVLERLEERIRSAGLEFLSKGELGGEVPDEKSLVRYLHILQEKGSIRRISGDLFLSGEAFDILLQRTGEILAEKESMSIGEFKDATGLSRKYAVPLLEFLDMEGYTSRRGDARVAGPKLPGRSA